MDLMKCFGKKVLNNPQIDMNCSKIFPNFVA